MAEVGQKRKADDANGDDAAAAPAAIDAVANAAAAAEGGEMKGTPPPEGEISDVGRLFWKGGMAVRGICENPYKNPDEDGANINDPVLRRLKENFAGGSVLDHKRRRTGDSPGQDDRSNDADEYADEVLETQLPLNLPSQSGEILFCGATNWDLLSGGSKNIKNMRNIWNISRLNPLQGIPVAVVASSSASFHSVVITAEGQTYSWGRADKGQIGTGEAPAKPIMQPTLLKTLETHRAVGAATGRYHSMVLIDDGSIFAFGLNQSGQCGIGNTQEKVLLPTKVKAARPFRQVSCGGEFSMAVDTRGSLHSWGSPEYGQLGHNDDGKYFVTASKLAFQNITQPQRIERFIEKDAKEKSSKVPGKLLKDVYIVDVSCGPNHSVAVDMKGRVYSWGFGGYGRLGHGKADDELQPRLVEGEFRSHHRGGGATKCWAGSQYCIVKCRLGTVFFWGTNRPSTEAHMKPLIMADIEGRDVQNVGASKSSIVVTTADHAMSWGPSPTLGELGHGHLMQAAKRPEVIKKLKGMTIHNLTCGFGHTLFIAKSDLDEEKKNLLKMNVFKA